jgi:AraC-like DNA-binding protein/CRP-like cAMP-binding protein
MVVDAGAFLFRAGDPVDAVTWIADGLVTLVRQHDATRDLPVGLCGAGRILGAIGAMEQQRHHVSAVALVPTRVSRMPAPRFRDQLKTSRDFLRFATVAIDREWQASLEDSMRAFLHTPDERLIGILRSLVNGTPAHAVPGLEVVLPAAVGDALLADLLCVSRERLDHLLRMWEQSGCCRREAGVRVFHLTRLFLGGHGAEATSDAPGPLTGGAAAAFNVPAAVVHDDREAEAVEFVLRHYMDASLGLAQLGRRLNLSSSHASRLFKRQTGLSFRQFVNFVRLDRAREALLTTRLSVKEICAAVGYNHISDMTRRFKAAYGLCPTDYRQRFRRDQTPAWRPRQSFAAQSFGPPLCTCEPQETPWTQ